MNDYMTAGEQGRDRLNELISEAAQERRAREFMKSNSKHNAATGVRALLIKVLSAFTG